MLEEGDAQVADLGQDEGHGETPEHGAPQHVEDDFSGGGAQSRRDDGANNGAQDQGGEESDAPHAEALPDADDAPAMLAEDGLLF